MSVVRTKNYVPEVYTSESRDFQLFLRVLDFVQNSLKYDIDTMICSLSTEDMPGQYLSRLKSKVGFYCSDRYSDESLRLALSVFPFIIRYKGSKKGIVMCVNAYLKHLGLRGESKVDIYNDHPTYGYTVRIGIPSKVSDTTLLTDLLSYILPTGYFVELYFYKDAPIAPITMKFVDDFTYMTPTEEENTSVRSVLGDILEHQTYSTTQLGTVYDPNNDLTEENP